jgi:hypothetical protein|tara:strand:+ start:297 stop:638 length:342 start_codon:yes stop_codon:yes gene_type:complete
MAGITRVNGFGQYAQGTVYSVAQLKAFLIDAGGSLAAEDDGAKEAMELLIQEVQPLMYYSTGTDGSVTVVCDGHGVDAASMQARIRALGSTAGPNNYDFTGATVTAASALVAS